MHVAIPCRKTVREHVIYASASFLMAFLWAYDRRPVLDVNTIQCVPLFQQVSHRTGLVMNCSAIRYRLCQASVEWEIIDSASKAHRDLVPARHYSRQLGYDFWTINRPIHPFSSWGAASYHSVVSYDCGWTTRIWPIKVQLKDVQFEIVKAD